VAIWSAAALLPPFSVARTALYWASLKKLPLAFAYLGKIKKQIDENESLRFGSTAFWNTFLQPYRRTGAAKRGETDFLCKFFAWFASE
jgi:hypothetical protein